MFDSTDYELHGFESWKDILILFLGFVYLLDVLFTISK